MEKQNIIDGIRLIVIIGVFIFMVIGSYRNIINQNKVISTNTYIDKDNEIVNSNLEKELQNVIIVTFLDPIKT